MAQGDADNGLLDRHGGPHATLDLPAWNNRNTGPRPPATLMGWIATCGTMRQAR